MRAKGLIQRSDSVGLVRYDCARDQFSAEIKEGAVLHPDSPLGIAWVIIGGCNLLCVHCYGNQEELPRVILSTKECLTIADKMIAAKVMRVVICGGEPLLRDDIFTIIKHLQEGGVSVVLGTNGTFINQGNIDSIVSCTRVEVSLDAATPESNNIIRPSRVKNGNAWTETMQAIQLCIEAKANLHILTALNLQNQTQIVGIASVLSGLGVTDWALSWTIPAGRARHIYQQLRPEAVVVEQGVLDARRLFPHITIRYTDRITESASRFYCLVLPDGSIGTEDVGQGKVLFGSLLEQNIASVWNPKNYDLRQHFQKWVGDRIIYV